VAFFDSDDEGPSPPGPQIFRWSMPKISRRYFFDADARQLLMLMLDADYAF